MTNLLSCLYIGVLLLLPLSESMAESLGYERFFDVGFGDFQEELARAEAEGKQGVLLFFEMKDCPFCYRMKETVLNQANVQSYFKKHFLNFKVDTIPLD